MYAALRGVGADDSIVVSSTLRRALSTVAIGLRSRFRRKPSERIKILSTLQVSVLLCTVTFNANLAHNLTRSP